MLDSYLICRFCHISEKSSKMLPILKTNISVNFYVKYSYDISMIYDIVLPLSNTFYFSLNNNFTSVEVIMTETIPFLGHPLCSCACILAKFAIRKH